MLTCSETGTRPLCNHLMQGAALNYPAGAFPPPTHRIPTAPRIRTQSHDQQLSHHPNQYTQSYYDTPVLYPSRSMTYTSHVTEHRYHPRNQQETHAHYPQSQMYPASLPMPIVPTLTQASGWVKPFNETEVQVEGIMPYSYGMRRYGPVSSVSCILGLSLSMLVSCDATSSLTIVIEVKLQRSFLSGADLTSLPL